MVIELNIQITP